MKKWIPILAVTAVFTFSGCKLDGIQYDFKSYNTYHPAQVLNAPAELPAVQPLKNIDAPSLQFFALGCAGSANEGQRLVAESMAKVAEGHKPDFVLYLGDNFYGRGVLSTEDPKWKTHFEDIFDSKALPMPFYAILGNHDHYLNPQAQIDYSKTNSRWRMDAPYYSFQKTIGTETVDFFAIDTTALLKGDATQLKWLEEKLGGSKASWKVVFGHHPVYSSATTYPKQTARHRQILEPVLLRHKTDLYIAAHNHSIEVLKEQNGIHYVVSGGGSRPRNVEWTESTQFAHADVGFAWLRIQGSTLEIAIVGKNGEVLFRKEIAKNV